MRLQSGIRNPTSRSHGAVFRFTLGLYTVVLFLWMALVGSLAISAASGAGESEQSFFEVIVEKVSYIYSPCGPWLSP